MSIWNKIFLDLPVDERILITDASKVTPELFHEKLVSSRISCELEIRWGSSFIKRPATGIVFLGTSSKFVGAVSADAAKDELALSGNFALMNPSRLVFEVAISIGTIFTSLMLLIAIAKIFSALADNQHPATFLYEIAGGALVFELALLGLTFFISALNYPSTRSAEIKLIDSFRSLREL